MLRTAWGAGVLPFTHASHVMWTKALDHIQWSPVNEEAESPTSGKGRTHGSKVLPVLNILSLNQVYFSTCIQAILDRVPFPPFLFCPLTCPRWGRSQDSAGAVSCVAGPWPSHCFSLRTAFLWLLEHELGPVCTSLMVPLKRFYLIHVGQISIHSFFLFES